MSKRFVILSIICTFLLGACQEQKTNEAALANPKFFHTIMKGYSDIIVYDIFSPPQASRNYAYPSIAAYEVLSSADSSYQSLSGQLNGFDFEVPAPAEDYSPSVAAYAAFLTAGKHFIFSEDKMEKLRNKIFEEIKTLEISTAVLDRSTEYGERVAQAIIDYAEKDNYKQTRTSPKYTVTNEPGKWKPTPPGYMDGIEPHWREIRTLVLDSAQQFIPEPPTPFDTTPGSQFYKETMEVYHAVDTANAETKEIASFWDCNPYVLNVTGHVMHATKKITPGGHWIGITKIACKKAKADLPKTIEAYTLTSIALFDAFISCWDEKYRSNLIRPETVINEYFDENWVPVLQTPPFPEHTSGHSVISRAAAVALTEIFGDDFSFKDNTEVEYGLPIRSFNSFIHASEEAAISRLYGGIHYMPAINYGVAQGQKVGEYIIENIELKKA